MQKESFPAVFHSEMRTEALLCWQPHGADITPGREKEKGVTGSVKPHKETRGKLKRIRRACGKGAVFAGVSMCGRVLMKEKYRE